MKTIHGIVSIVLLSALLAALGLPWAALAAEKDVRRLPMGGRLARFTDDAGLLTPLQAVELIAKLDRISERHQFDTVVAVTRSLGSGFSRGRDARIYAADFFEHNGFGFGRELHGAILLLATEDRDFAFAASGFGFTAFTPAGQEYLIKLFLPYLQSNNYFEAFMAYADAVDDFVTKAKTGGPYDSGNIPLTAEERAEFRMYAVVGSLALAFLIALLVTVTWAKQLKTVQKENFANAYIRGGSMVVSVQQDTFLYSQVYSVKRAQNPSAGGGSFRSSSGGVFTGRSGKY